MSQLIGKIEKGDYVKVKDDLEWHKVVGWTCYCWGWDTPCIGIGLELPDKPDKVCLVPMDAVIDHRISYENLRKKY